mgnify:CR=1 FL=1
MAANLISKIKNSIIKHGIFLTLLEIINYPIDKIKYRNFKIKVLSSNSNEYKFTWIYKNNHWQSKESASGTGSTLIYTENLRKELPKLFKKYSIKKYLTHHVVISTG